MKRYFSRLGMAYFAGTIVIYAVQMTVMAAVKAFCPQWLSDMTIYLILSMVPMYLIGQPIMAYMISRIPARGVNRDRKMTAGQLFTAFCIAYAILYISNLVGTGLTMVIGAVKGSAVQNMLADIILEANPAVVFVFTVLCAPVAEEWIFRKLLVDRAYQYGERCAVVLSGLMFGLFHGNLNQFAYAFALGMFLAFIYVKTGRIRYAILLHMMINFMGSAASVLIMKTAHYDEFLDSIMKMQGGQATELSVMLASVMENLSGMLLMSLYGCVLLALVLTGTILFFVNLKKFRLESSENRISEALLNPGMLLFLLFWVGMVIRQLLL